MQVSYEEESFIVTDKKKRLGKSPAKSHPLMLSFSDYTTDKIPPPSTNFWHKKTSFEPRTYGNTEYGDCTRASQAVFITHMERLESRRTIKITDDEVIKRYMDMTSRLYGGGDTGGFELDALNEWRNPDLTIRDVKGHPYTIDAYTRINQANIEEVKRAIYFSGSHGIKACFSLPLAFQENTDVWDIPEGQQPIGEYLAGSWGGHSTCSARDFDKDWLYFNHTWGVPDGKISWRAFSIYCDEAYSVIDSVDSWRKKIAAAKISFDLPKLISDVNNVSPIKIK